MGGVRDSTLVVDVCGGVIPNYCMIFLIALAIMFKAFLSPVDANTYG
jgi:hypothetical protein